MGDKVEMRDEGGEVQVFPPANLLTDEELGIVFEACGLALRQSWTQPQTNLDFVYKVTEFMRRITPAVQSLASRKQEP